MKLGQTSITTRSNFEHVGPLHKLAELQDQPISISRVSRTLTGPYGNYVIATVRNDWGYENDEGEVTENIAVAISSAAVMQTLTRFFAEYPGETLECVPVKKRLENGNMFWDLVDPDDWQSKNGSSSPAASASLKQTRQSQRLR